MDFRALQPAKIYTAHKNLQTCLPTGRSAAKLFKQSRKGFYRKMILTFFRKDKVSAFLFRPELEMKMEIRLGFLLMLYKLPVLF